MVCVWLIVLLRPKSDPRHKIVALWSRNTFLAPFIPSSNHNPHEPQVQVCGVSQWDAGCSYEYIRSRLYWHSIAGAVTATVILSNNCVHTRLRDIV